MMKSRQPRSDFVFLTFHVAFEGGMNVGSRVIDFRKGNLAFASGKRIAGVGVLKFYHRADVTRIQGRDTSASFPIKQINLANFLGAAPSRVVKFAAELY